MKKGFTLLEMLVVIGIISILTAVSVVGYSHVLAKGEQARAREVVSNAATALTALFDRDGVWPKAIRDLGEQGGKLDEKIAWYLRKDFSVNVASSDDSAEEGQRKTIGYDRFGIVTPWATAVIKRRGTDVVRGTKVVGDSSIDDHTLRFAVDLDGDGIIENVQIGGVGKGAKTKTISVRATAVVWSCNKDGVIDDYDTGLRKDGVYSWAYGQTQKVK